MIIKQLKTARFDWNGKTMTITHFVDTPAEPEGPEMVKLSRVHLLSLIRFGLRVLSKKK